MACQVKVVEDSLSPSGVRLTTMQLRYWRAIHAEFMTHRVFSRNASSSRAIPVSKMIEQVRNDPAGPIHWGENRPGMQATGQVPGLTQFEAQKRWLRAANTAADHAQALLDLNIHKQVANRLLEPFQYINVVVTATEWANWFALRDHEAAQPEIQELARAMGQAMEDSDPVFRLRGEWHLPYVTLEERRKLPIALLRTLSTARCARVSYNRHDGTPAPQEEDIALHDRLIRSTPQHASPSEHQACSMPTDAFIKNFRGWRMYRDYLEAA